MSRPLALFVAALLVAGAAVVSVVTSVPAILLAGALPMAAGFAAIVTLGETAFPLVGYAFTRTGDGAALRPSWRRPDARGWLLVVAGTIATVGVNRLVFVLGASTGVDPVATVTPPDGLGLAGLLAIAPVLLFVVGPAEEYFFRGVVQAYLADSFSTWGAIGWATVLFTLIHLPNALFVLPEALVVSVPIWLVVGAIFGWLYRTTGTLVVPALVHGLYDVVVFALLFAEWGLV